ncbi:enolase-binding protein-like [Anopheles ziemanni]|uniref:enolase-binding protein-like n=1 Tax=Anopheles coustani TaxID=139045 RepID=UPI002657BFB3|nr:enolase-binding protein-like [Anopheles coustani]XP_058171910.1 enolase-binding protein-like [Anopheles ziemanni]
MAIGNSWWTVVLLLSVAGFATSSNDIGRFLVNSRLEINVKSLLSEVCGTNSSLLSIAVKSLSNEYSDRTVENLCRNATTDVLLWIPVGNFENLADTGSSNRYLGKSFGDEDFAEYCSYDVTTKVCTADNGVVEGSILVLAEKFPERYELRDIVYKKWTNSTRLGSPILAYATLKNRDPAYKYVDQDISYLADTRIDYVLPPTVTHGVQLSVYRGKTETYKLIAGETYYSRVFKTVNAIRFLSPFTTMNLTVIGSEVRDYREFRAKLVTIYTDEEGYGWSKSLSSVEAAVIETKLTETHVEYALPVNLYDSQPVIPNQPIVEGNNGNQGLPTPKPILAKPENIHIHISELDIGQAYPGFRNVAIAAAILFFSVLGLALLDIIRRVIANRRAKRLHLGKYSRT